MSRGPGKASTRGQDARRSCSERRPAGTCSRARNDRSRRNHPCTRCCRRSRKRPRKLRRDSDRRWCRRCCHRKSRRSERRCSGTAPCRTSRRQRRNTLGAHRSATRSMCRLNTRRSRTRRRLSMRCRLSLCSVRRAHWHCLQLMAAGQRRASWLLRGNQSGPCSLRHPKCLRLRSCAQRRAREARSPTARRLRSTVARRRRASAASGRSMPYLVHGYDHDHAGVPVHTRGTSTARRSRAIV